MERSLEIATDHYYWKPNQGFFGAFALEAFAAAQPDLGDRVLDLGSGDAVFASMLRERGVLAKVDLSLDYGEAPLGDVRANGFPAPVRGDARRLPAQSGVFSGAFSGAVLNALDEAGLDAAFAELHRVLAPGGVLAFADPTPRFLGNLAFPRWLRPLGLADLYLRRLQPRLMMTRPFGEEWLHQLEAAGFEIEQVRWFFLEEPAHWWEWLKLHAMRVFAVLRLVPFAPARRASSRLQRRLFRPVLERESRVPDDERGPRAGFVLVVARKQRV